MGRTHDILIPPETSWLADPAAQHLCRTIQDAGHDIFFVGGCVRNALLNLPDSDVDMSTDAHPERVVEIVEAQGLKAIPTGIDHGTITVVVDGKPFEVTTFRRDVSTDGRRAVVAFSDNIQDDARRRDFTMNALYATTDGEVVDPLGGLPDALSGRIRFIEDPVQRIKEDYLRILRFFRFSAWYANPTTGFEPDTLAAIASNTDGLDQLSSERIGQEMRKLLEAPDPSQAVAAMRQTGVLNRVLPGADDRFLSILIHIEQTMGITRRWINRLAVLGGHDVATQLRMSKADARELAILRDVAFEPISLSEIAYRHGLLAAEGSMIIRAAFAERMPEHSMLETILTASRARFPVSSKDLISQLQGPALGAKLKELEERWIASNFSLSADELLR